MEAVTIQSIWEEMSKVEADAKLPYPCDKTPGLYKDKEGKLDCIIAGASQIKVMNLGIEKRGKIVKDEDREQKEIFQPKVYQDCMNPKQILIYTLQITQPQPDCLLFTDHFETHLVELKGKKIEICPWEAEIHKAGCVPCTNCGKCGW